MELNGKKVSSRFYGEGVFLGVYAGEFQGKPFKKLLWCDQNGEHSMDFTPDLPDLVPGQNYRFGFRLYSPDVQHSKYPRKFIVDFVCE